MSVISPTTGDLFRVSVRKSHVNNPDRQWENNYELRCVANTNIAAVNTMALKIVAFEKAIHYDQVEFRAVRVSTWEEDSKPYDPSTFTSLPLTGLGELDTATEDMAAINVCLNTVRVPLSGRYGHIYYRGALVESDIEAPAGKYILSTGAAIDTRFTTELGSSGVGDMFNDIDEFWEMVMINKTGTQIRKVVGFSPQGVAVVPFDHAWFNRTPAP